MCWLYKVLTLECVCLLSGRHDETQLCKSWLSKAKRPLSYYAVILCYIIPTWNVRTVPGKWLNHPQMSAYLDVPSFYFEGAGWDNYFMRREGSYCNVHLLFPRNWADMIPAFTWIAACIFPLAWTNRGFFFFSFLEEANCQISQAALTCLKIKVNPGVLVM